MAKLLEGDRDSLETDRGNGPRGPAFVLPGILSPLEQDCPILDGFRGGP